VGGADELVLLERFGEQGETGVATFLVRFEGDVDLWVSGEIGVVDEGTCDSGGEDEIEGGEGFFEDLNQEGSAPFGLGVLDGGDETGGAEDGGPIVFGDEVQLAVSGDGVEHGGGFNGDDGVKAGDLFGQAEFAELCAEGGEHLCVLGVSAAEDADLPAFEVFRGGVLEGAVERAVVLGVCAEEGGENEGGVLGGPADGADFIHGPGEGHAAGATDAAEGGTKAGDTATAGGADDGAAGFRSDGEGDETGGHGGGGTGAGTA